MKTIPIELKEISNRTFGSRIAIWVGILMAGGVLAAGEAPLTIALGIALLGVGIAHGVELCHQALHNTGFTSPRLNEIVGVMLGLPLLVSFYEYRISHLAHHKYVGTPQDTEYFDYGDGPLTFRRFIDTLSMRQHYSRFLHNFVLFLIDRPIPGFREKHQPILRRYYLVVIGFIATLAVVGILTGTGWRPFLTWLAAMVLIAGPIHALIEFPEHYKCDAETKDILCNTRSIQAGWFMTWFTNGNNFHVEHHMYPTVPLHHARQVHNILHPDHRHYNNGYRDFYRTIFRSFSNEG
ncbi:MAG: fatty acid desaturase [Verrucomicrobia bacterium]|jgi:fatty acid desaturase|nr:fatty acid desaturase [Verrucomicrobiota bacterium]